MRIDGKALYGLICLALVLTGCDFKNLFPKNPVENQGSSDPITTTFESASVETREYFTLNIHSFVSNNCTTCHDTGNAPRKFAVADVAASYDAVASITDLNNPSNSLIVSWGNNSHCGSNCTGGGTDLIPIISDWAAEVRTDQPPDASGDDAI